MYVISYGNSHGIERLQQHPRMETMTWKNVRKTEKMWESDKIHAPHLDKHCNCVFCWGQCDRCDPCLELHVCGRTNSLWVGRTTHPKKDLHVIGRTEKKWKKKKWKEDFKTDEECLQHFWKRSNSPQEMGPLPFSLLLTNTSTVQTSLESLQSCLVILKKKVMMKIKISDWTLNLWVNYTKIHSVKRKRKKKSWLGKTPALDLVDTPKAYLGCVFVFLF